MLEVSKILMKAKCLFSDSVHKTRYVRSGSHLRKHPLYESLLLSQKNEHQSLYRHHSVENPLSGKKFHPTLNRSDSKEIRSVPYFESDLYHFYAYVLILPSGVTKINLNLLKAVKGCYSLPQVCSLA